MRFRPSSTSGSPRSGFIQISGAVCSKSARLTCFCRPIWLCMAGCLHQLAERRGPDTRDLRLAEGVSTDPRPAQSRSRVITGRDAG